MTSSPSPSARAILLSLALALVLAMSGLPDSQPRAVAQPTTPTTSTFIPFTADSVSLDSTATAVARNGAFAFRATVRLAKPTTYLRVRLRVYRPSGRLLYQRTFVRADVPAGELAFSFARGLADLELRPAVYPVELTVLAEGAPERSWRVPRELRVYDPTTSALPVAIIVKVTSAPSVDPEGRFVLDPSVEVRARDEVRRLADAILAQPRFRASVAVPGELLEEWKQISDGYETIGAAGVQVFGAESTTARAYASTLSRLASAVKTGRLELLNVPYADPDIAGLVTAGRLRDLRAHYARNAAACQAALEETPSAGTITARACLIAAAAREVANAKIHYALVAPSYTRAGDSTSAAGVYSSKNVPVTMLVPDDAAANEIASGNAEAGASALFTRAIAAGDEHVSALPLVVEVGPGRVASVDTLLAGLAGVLGEPWLALATAGQVAKTPAKATTTLAPRVSVSTNTPTGWWESVAQARRQAEALTSALPAENAVADAAASGSLIAESSSWAGPDGRWALADRARAFVSAADRLARSIFDKVAIDAQDITLSGVTGSVPLSVTNESGSSLRVTLRATPSGVKLRGSQSKIVTLLPAENYLTVPVDLRSSTGGTLKLEVVADTVVVASRVVTVRASYLDRLVTIALITLVLGAMLFYIRRRVRSVSNPVDGR